MKEDTRIATTSRRTPKGTVLTLVRLPNGEIVEEADVAPDTFANIIRDAWDGLMDALSRRLSRDR